MSHTNVTIPESFNTQDRLIEEIELLKFQKSRLEKRIRYLEDEFKNVFDAVKEWGYVDLTYGKETIVLVEKFKEQHGGE